MSISLSLDSESCEDVLYIPATGHTIVQETSEPFTLTLDLSPEDDEGAVSLRVLGPRARGVAVQEHKLCLNVLEHDADAWLLSFVL